VPELTAQVARAVCPNGNRYMQMRDTLGTIDADVRFADLYPTGKPPRPCEGGLIGNMR
jgi:transposase